MTIKELEQEITMRHNLSCVDLNDMTFNLNSNDTSDYGWQALSDIEVLLEDGTVGKIIDVYKSTDEVVVRLYDENGNNIEKVGRVKELL